MFLSCLYTGKTTPSLKLVVDVVIQYNFFCISYMLHYWFNQGVKITPWFNTIIAIMKTAIIAKQCIVSSFSVVEAAYCTLLHNLNDKQLTKCCVYMYRLIIIKTFIPYLLLSLIYFIFRSYIYHYTVQNNSLLKVVSLQLIQKRTNPGTILKVSNKQRATSN